MDFIKNKILITRILYATSTIIFLLSLPFRHFTWEGFQEFLQLDLLTHIIWRSIGAVFIIISNVKVKRRIQGAIKLAIVGIVIIGLNLIAFEIIPIILFTINAEVIILWTGFYLGFIPWCIFIIVIVLLVKHKRDIIDSLVKQPQIKTRDLKGESVKQSNGERNEKLIIFISYAIDDSQFFNVREIAEKLTSYNNIGDVLYCEEDARDNFIKYMNEYIGKCDVMILFCSPNALKSEFVEDEWMAARAMRKLVIPVFLKKEHIPPLLRARTGIEFNAFKPQKNIEALYTLILKKTKFA